MKWPYGQVIEVQAFLLSEGIRWGILRQEKDRWSTVSAAKMLGLSCIFLQQQHEQLNFEQCGSYTSDLWFYETKRESNGETVKF